MTKLWRALALLAQDRELRDRVRGVAGEINNPSLPNLKPDLPNLQEQPDLARVAEIDQMFRERGLHLTIYDLSEINRWMVRDRVSRGPVTPSERLDRIWNEVRTAAAQVPEGGYPAFQEAVGALIADEGLRSNFGAGTRLTQRGFNLAPHVEDALLTASRTAVFRDESNAFVLETWDGSQCATRLESYPGYIHFNM
jgi:hypothetical protein